MRIPYYDRRRETASRDELRQLQWQKLKVGLGQVLSSNPFYRGKYAEAGLTHADEMESLDDLRRLPFTTKRELVADQENHPPYGTDLTYPVSRYVRLHQTSGTSGRPLSWLDTRASWDWVVRCWAYVLRGAGVGPGDRIYYAFSFGPFLGFWSGFEAAEKVGALALALAGGGLDSLGRLQAILDSEANVLVCTPTYALRLAQEAHAAGLDIVHSAVEKTIHAGEPGASIPATKERLQTLWGALCFDHTGMTEVGPTGFECLLQPAGVHLIESEYIFEVIDPNTGEGVPEGQEGELVITNLGRWASPLLRYRSGDVVCLESARCACGRSFARMRGGIRGRTDDMVVVRGINIFPSAIDNVVRRHPEVEEYQVEVYREREMREIRLRLELNPSLSQETRQRKVAAVANELQQRLHLRVETVAVPSGTLPRFEMKARRFIRKDL